MMGSQVLYLREIITCRPLWTVIGTDLADRHGLGSQVKCIDGEVDIDLAWSFHMFVNTLPLWLSVSHIVENEFVTLQRLYTRLLVDMESDRDRSTPNRNLVCLCHQL